MKALVVVVALAAVAATAAPADEIPIRDCATRAEPTKGRLRFANAQDPTGRLEFEVGVFEVRGMSAADLASAIVASTRPNAPGLFVDHATLGGKPVTTVVYPGGTVFYLYEQDGRVFYIGTQSKPLAVKAIGLLP